MKAAQNRRHLVLAGIGSGNFGTITQECRAAISAADVIFGSGRVLALAKNIIWGKDSSVQKKAGGQDLPRMEEMYEGREIFAFLEAHEAFRRPVALLSGDIGFFSGAVGIMRAFDGKKGWDISALPGISSAAVLAARLGISWQDARMISTHGRDMARVNPTGWIRASRKVFILVSGPADVRRIGNMLLRQGDFGGEPGMRLAFGTDLGMEDEAFGFCTAEELAGFDRQGLTLLYIENAGAEKRILTPGIPDRDFVRRVQASGAIIPMTKEEVRSISLARLRMTPSSVLWDIGAGCGSVSIEAARLAPSIRVYAIEMREDAAAVIAANAEKFGVENVNLVRAKAPEGLDGLPAPTHVFVGGSSGNIRAILAYVKAVSPRVRVVINTVTLETQAEALSAIKSLSFTEPEVRMVSAARAENVGRVHLMKAINPVTVIDCEGI